MNRYNKILRQRYRALFHYLGTIIFGVGLYALVPLSVLVVWPQEWQWAPAFVATGALGLVTGWTLKRSFPVEGQTALSLEEGGVLVLLAWASAIGLSALPFVISGQLSILEAVFEAVSGWTTTGLSVVDVAAAPHIFLLWRSLMQLAGGAGLAVIMLAAIIGPHGLGLYEAEGRTDQLLPHVRRSTNLIVRIYLGYVVAGTVLYVFTGMTVFDAINHSIAALSTGGFSTKVNSIGEYGLFPVELVTLVLMLLGTTNFLIHYLLLQGKFRLVSRQGEVRLLGLLLALFVPFILVVSALPLYQSLGKALRVAAFETISALSTTGFSTVPYGDWSDAGVLALVILMLIGGGAGSTAGGIKLYRVYVWGRSFFFDLRRHFLPQNAVFKPYLWRGQEKFYLTDRHVKEVGGYIVLYMVTYLIGVLALVTQGFPLRESLFEFASALGTVGLSIGITGPGASPGLMVTEILGMMLGRLEFLVIFFSGTKLVRDLRYLAVHHTK